MLDYENHPYFLFNSPSLIIYIYIVLLKYIKKDMNEQLLRVEFLKSDMERLDNPKYFMKDFQCEELIKFFSQISTLHDINERREQINLFYDRYINITITNKNLYVQLKWIIIMHQIIQKFKSKTPLYGFTLKALQLNLEELIKYENNVEGFEKYLSHILVKPYIQHLCKLCLLNIPEETAKYDVSSASVIQLNEVINDQKENKQAKQTYKLNMKLVQWYRKYNFVSETLNTFQPVLCEVYNFFTFSYPFLNSISKIISNDLNNVIFKLKYNFRSLKKSNVSLLELDQLESRLKKFNNAHKQFLEDMEVQSKIQDFTKDELQQFLQSPLKPNQLKLYTKKSLTSPIFPVK